MHALTATILLGAWERGLSQSPTQRALTLAELACHDLSRHDMSRLAIGRRDACLLDVREAAFGSTMTGVVDCPACSRRLELTFRVSDVRAIPDREGDGPYTLRHNDHEVTFRLPDSDDLAAVSNQLDKTASERLLLERCVLSVQYAGKTIQVGALPDEIRAVISARMAELDPQSDVRLALRCPDCDHSWEASLDIVSYLWAEVHALALRLLRDVHALASAHGWREDDILALSPQRRQAYLEMIRR